MVWIDDLNVLNFGIIIGKGNVYPRIHLLIYQPFEPKSKSFLTGSNRKN
jgi:hypothetical protein